MAKIEKEITITNKLGLHARPAAEFVKAASQSQSEIYITKDGERIDGKSIMGILTLEAHCGTKIVLEVDGEDAEEIFSVLVRILEGNGTDE